MSASLPVVPYETRKEEMKTQFDEMSQAWLDLARFDPTINPRFDPRVEYYSNEKVKKRIKDLIAFILDGKINQEKFSYGLRLLPENDDADHPFGFIYTDDHRFPVELLHFLPMFLYQLARRKVFDSFMKLFCDSYESLNYRYELIEKPLKMDLFRKIFEKQGDEFFDVCGTCLLFAAIELGDIVFFKYILQRSKKDFCNARWPDSVVIHPYNSPYALDRAIYLYAIRDHSQDRQDIADILLEMGCNPNIHPFSILARVSHDSNKPYAIYQLLKFGAKILNLNIQRWHSDERLYKELKTSCFSFALKGFMETPGERYLRIIEILCNEGALLVSPEYRIKLFDRNCQELNPGYDFNAKLFSEDVMNLALRFDTVPPSRSSWSRFTSVILSPLVSMNLVPKKIEVNDITVGELSISEIALRFIRNGKPSWLFTITDLKSLLNSFFTHREEFDDEQAERFARIAAQVLEFEDPKNEILKRGVKEAFLEFDEKVKDEFKAIQETLMAPGRLHSDTSLLTMQYLYALRSDNVPTTYCPAYLRRKANDPKLSARRPGKTFVAPASAAVAPASAAASSTIPPATDQTSTTALLPRAGAETSGGESVLVLASSGGGSASVPAPSGGGSTLVPAPVQAIPAPHAETKEVQDIQFSTFYQQHTLPAFAAHIAAAASSTDPSPAVVVDPAPETLGSRLSKRQVNT